MFYMFYIFLSLGVSTVETNKDQDFWIYRDQLLKLVKIILTVETRLFFASVKIFKIETFKIETFKIETFKIETFKIETFKIETFKIETFKIETFKIETFELRLGLIKIFIEIVQINWDCPDFQDLSRYLNIYIWRTSGSKILTNWEILIEKSDKIG